MERLKRLAMVNTLVWHASWAEMVCGDRFAIAHSAGQGFLLSLEFIPPNSPRWLSQVTLLLALHEGGLDDGIYHSGDRWWFCRFYGEQSTQAIERGVVLQLGLVGFLEAQLTQSSL